MEQKKTNKTEEKKSYGTVILLVIIAVLLIGGLIVYGVMNSKEKPVEEEMETTYGDETLCIDPDVDKALSDYRLIEIAGIDQGPRTDVIFVAALNKKTKEGKLFTVYRDTLMQLSPEGKTYPSSGHEYKFFKCNHAYYYEGKRGSMKMLNAHLDLNIREFLGINWDGVKYLVDEVGGIDVDVTSNIIGLINGNLDDQNKITTTGMQTLNGTQAVQYCRVRKDADATVRSHRNEDVIIQLFNRINQFDTKKKIELYDKLVDYFDTNMSRTTVTELISELTSVSLTTVDGFPNDYTIMWDEWDAFYYYVPQPDLVTNVTKLHADAFGQSDYKPSKMAQKMNDNIKNHEVNLH